MAQWSNLKVKAAVGSVYPTKPDSTFHCRPIPEGYAKVMVDEIMEGFEELELDHPTGEGEIQLGLGLKTPCLWRKEYIKLPNWTHPPPPPPPVSQGTPPPPPACEGTPAPKIPPLLHPPSQQHSHVELDGSEKFCLVEEEQQSRQPPSR